MFKNLFEKYDKIVFFDTETTGFDAETADQIIELAAISIDKKGNQAEMDEFIQLFKMECLPEKITGLTGIMDLTLASQGVEEYDALQKFIDMLQDGEKTLLIAHNAQFDLKFMAYAVHRNKNKEWMQIFNACDYLDTLTVYKDRRMYPHKLESAIVEYHLINKVQNTHRAIDDCSALLEVARCMDEEKPDLDRYVNLFGFNPKYGPDKATFKKITYAPQSMNAYCGKALYEL